MRRACHVSVALRSVLIFFFLFIASPLRQVAHLFERVQRLLKRRALAGERPRQDLLLCSFGEPLSEQREVADQKRETLLGQKERLTWGDSNDGCNLPAIQHEGDFSEEVTLPNSPPDLVIVGEYDA